MEFFRLDEAKKGLGKKILGALCGVLGLLAFAQNLSGILNFTYPALSTELTVGLYFAGLFIILAGVALLLFGKFKGSKVMGILLMVLGLSGLILILGGPSEVPFLTFGIPAVLSLYFDVFSGVMQAFVFSLLSMIYISNACPPPEERIVRGKNRKSREADASGNSSL